MLIYMQIQKLICVFLKAKQSEFLISRHFLLKLSTKTTKVKNYQIFFYQIFNGLINDLFSVHFRFHGKLGNKWLKAESII